MAISVQTILYINYFVLAVFTSGLSVVILQLVRASVQKQELVANVRS